MRSAFPAGTCQARRKIVTRLEECHRPVALVLPDHQSSSSSPTASTHRNGLDIDFPASHRARSSESGWATDERGSTYGTGLFLKRGPFCPEFSTPPAELHADAEPLFQALCVPRRHSARTLGHSFLRLHGHWKIPPASRTRLSLGPGPLTRDGACSPMFGPQNRLHSRYLLRWHAGGSHRRTFPTPHVPATRHF